jgi:hypothetical protein
LTTPEREREARVEGVRKVRPSWAVREGVGQGVSLERSKVRVGCMLPTEYRVTMDAAEEVARVCESGEKASEYCNETGGRSACVQLESKEKRESVAYKRRGRLPARELALDLSLTALVQEYLAVRSTRGEDVSVRGVRNVVDERRVRLDGL